MRALLTMGLMASLAAGAVLAQAPPAAAPAVPTVVKVGDMAPDFTMPGTDGKTHKLSDYRGKHVVLAWYPAAFTGGCTAECKSFHEAGPEIKAFDVAYFMAKYAGKLVFIFKPAQQRVSYEYLSPGQRERVNCICICKQVEVKFVR